MSDVTIRLLSGAFLIMTGTLCALNRISFNIIPSVRRGQSVRAGDGADPGRQGGGSIHYTGRIPSAAAGHSRSAGSPAAARDVSTNWSTADQPRRMRRPRPANGSVHGDREDNGRPERNRATRREKRATCSCPGCTELREYMGAVNRTHGIQVYDANER